MKRIAFCSRAVLAFLVVAALLVLPASGAIIPNTTTAAATQEKPFVTATVSAASITAGTPLTVRGTATGNVTAGVQIWAFAGNYVNVSIVPVSADGSYSKTFDTTGLPPATYYIFVQHPGSDNKLQITTSGLSGQVVNANTGAVIFNFTGTGSVKDNAAAIALSDALSTAGIDDIYTKAQFAIITPGATTPEATTAMMPGSDRDSHGCIPSAGYTWCEAKQKCLRPWEESCTAESATPPATAAPTTAKSPLPVLTVIAGIALACCAAALSRRR